MAAFNGTPVTGTTSGFVGRTYDVSAAGPAMVPAAYSNPQRRYLLFLFQNDTGFVSPGPGSALYGMASETEKNPPSRLIHRATYPGLIEGDWFFYDPAGGSCRVYDVWDPPTKPCK